MHVHDTGKRFGRRFAAPEIFPVTRVARQKDVILHAVLGVLGHAVLRPGRTVQHVPLRDVPMTARRDHHFHNVLDLFHRGHVILSAALDRVHHQLGDGAHVGEVGKAQAEAVGGIIVQRVRRVVVP